MKGQISFRLVTLYSFFVALLVIKMTGCQQPEQNQIPSTIREVLNNLKVRTDIITMGNKDGPILLITPELGARVLGASVNGMNGKNLFFVNPEVYTDEFWKDGPSWNAGGYRSWIAPEDNFYLKDDDTWFVPKSMDPGNYKLENSNDHMAIFGNEFSLVNRKGQEYNCKLIREIHLLETWQFPAVGQLPDDIKYVGTRLVHSLENLGDKIIGKDLPYIGLWSLLMVNPSGTMIIPLTKSGGKGEAFRDYGEPDGKNFSIVPPDRIAVGDRAITVKIDGKYRCKLGINPEYAGAGIAFLAEDEQGQGRLYIKHFMVDPKGKYLDHPWGLPSDYGDAIQMYNDDGKMGGFAELECHGPSHILAPKEKQSHDIFVHILTGPVDKLKEIGSQILELDFSQLTFF